MQDSIALHHGCHVLHVAQATVCVSAAQRAARQLVPAATATNQAMNGAAGHGQEAADQARSRQLVPAATATNQTTNGVSGNEMAAVNEARSVNEIPAEAKQVETDDPGRRSFLRGWHVRSPFGSSNGAGSNGTGKGRVAEPVGGRID